MDTPTNKNVPGFSTYDALIKKWASHYQFPWRLIKAQVWQESCFDQQAVSSCGAKGLMQLMPETDFWLDQDYDAFDPDGNIENGVRYDRWLWDHFPEIPNPEERISFMLAAYNGGRGTSTGQSNWHMKRNMVKRCLNPITESLDTGRNGIG